MTAGAFRLQAAAASFCRWHFQLRYDSRVTQLRKYSIFQDFSRKLKGEIESNPELKKSLKDLQEKAGSLKDRTKETAGQLYKHVDAARDEAQTTAKRVSSVIKEKFSQASEQVKETVAGVKSELKPQEEPTQGPPEPATSAEAQNVSSAETTRSAEAATGAETQKVSSAEAATSAEAQRVSKAEPESVSRQASKETSSKETGSGSSASQETEATGSQAHQQAETREQPGQDDAKPSSSSRFAAGTIGGKIAAVAKEGYNLLAEELTSTRKVKQKPAIRRSSATGMVPVVENKTGWRKRLDEMKDKVTEHPVFQRFKTVKEHPVVQKSQEIAEEMRERWETSDSPVVHKIQDLNDSLFGETSSAAAIKEIRCRDPTFSLADFVLEVQEDIRPVLTAYHKGDFETLKRKCSKEIVERCRAEHRALRGQGLYVDNKILFISDVEVKESKMIGNDPMIIVAFRTQQSYCVRDEFGKIKEGSRDDIRSVYYAWAMQQVSPEEMDAEDITPRWQLREMQQLGVQAII